MDATLHIRLIGRPTISIDDNPPLHFRAKRAELLIAYLALTRQSFGRETLATWLWEDRTQKQSMANMRRLLAKLPAEIKPYLRLEKQAVGLDFDRPIQVDLWAWEAAITERKTADLQTLSTQFNPTLLDGMLVRDSWSVDEWIITQQANWQQTTLNAFRLLAQNALHHREHQAGIDYAKRLVELDPLLESSHRLLMRLYVRDGERTLALRQFETCREVLQEELAVAPDAETIALAERIRHAQEQPPHAVPVPNVTFIGRKQLRAHLQAQLDQPDCRLITLVGMGGVGKTRLAIQAAHDRRGDYLNGIYFVSLTAITTQAGIVDGLIDALDFAAASGRPRKKQLLEHLQDLELLLILDNFEQIVDAGLPLLQEILASCPRLQLLITSRERLNIGAEWRVEVGGITERADAVALFLLHAQKYDRRWIDAGDDERQIWNICRLVEGLPLGIELAAAALAYHSIEQIAAEISQNVDFLHTNRRDMPIRHRTAHAIFTYSWELLSPHEQETFAQCAHFLGGFSAETARAITNTHPATLQSLVDKSLLRVAESGRFSMHELLRQFAALQVKDAAALQARLAAHFLHFLREQFDTRSSKWTRKVAREWENIQTAWRWAFAHNQFALINVALDALSDYCFRINTFQVGLELLHTDGVDDDFTCARLLIRRASFLTLLAHYDQAEIALNESVERLAASGEKSEYNIENAIMHRIFGSIAAAQSDYTTAVAAYEKSLTFCDSEVGLFSPTNVRLALVKPTYYLGDHDKAQALITQVIAEYKQQNDKFYLARAQTRLADLMEKEGDWQSAETLLLETLELQRELRDEVGMAKTYGLLADKAVWKDDIRKGIYYTEQSLAIHHRIGAPLSIAIQLGNLGTFYHELKEYDKAEACYAESLRRSEQIGDRLGVVFTAQNMAELYEWQDQIPQAIKAWEHSFAIAVELQVTERILHSIAGLAQTKVIREWSNDPLRSAERAYDLAHFVNNHPSTVPETRRYLERTLAAAKDHEPQSLTLDDAIAYCQETA